MSKRKAYFLMLVNTIFWGIAPAVIGYGLQGLKPITFLYYRYFIVSVIVIAYLIFARKIRSTAKVFTFKNIIIMLLITPIPLILIFVGMQYISSIVAAIVTAFTPVIAEILGAIFLKEKITRSEKIGTGIALVGIICVAFLQSQGGNKAFGMELIGMAMILLNAILWLIGNMFFKKAPAKEQDSISLGSFLLSLVLFGVITAFIDTGNLLTLPSMNILWPAIYMAIPGTLIAALAYQEAVKHIEISETSVFVYLQPVFGIPAGILLLGEHINPWSVLPLLVIVAGIYLNVYEKFRKNRK